MIIAGYGFKLISPKVAYFSLDAKVLKSFVKIAKGQGVGLSRKDNGIRKRFT
ncbi:hypothetical protein N751_16635 [Legionella pneumophila str. Leg01/11]|nr:hypothetical protein N751_16635 [Legionella pneumophila str. Leg01/11]